MTFGPSPRPPRSMGGVEYRLYFLDGAGHIERVHEFEAGSDNIAVKISEAWREGRRMELWQGERLVSRWT